jgi:hypothetical protein
VAGPLQGRRAKRIGELLLPPEDRCQSHGRVLAWRDRNALAGVPLTADEIASKLKLARCTVAAWLTRRGLGRLTALEPKVAVVPKPTSCLQPEVDGLGNALSPYRV